MNAKLAMWVLLGVLVVSGLPNAATAAEGPYFSHYAVTPWDYLPRDTYESVRSTIPYFALHPPVYYSHSVRRPYGYSPYAYFPGTMPRQIQPSSPVVVQNWYVSGMAAPRPSPKPLRIVNPYVAKPGDPGVSPGAVMPRQPQIIYPAAPAGQDE